MRKNEVIGALKCCSKKDCNKCIMREPDCFNRLAVEALELIKRQDTAKSGVKRSGKQRAEQKKKVVNFVDDMMRVNGVPENYGVEQAFNSDKLYRF